MRLTCMGCGTDYDGDACSICYKYDTEDCVMDDSKPPRVVALEAQNAEMLAMLKTAQATLKNAYNSRIIELDNLIKKVEGENGK